MDILSPVPPFVIITRADLLTVHDIFSDNKVLSYLILSYLRIYLCTEP